MGDSVVLSYSTPHVLFDRPYRHRSWNAVAGLVFVGIMGGGCAWMALAMPASNMLPFLIGRATLLCLSAAFGVALGVLAYRLFRDDRDHARITLEGIELKNQVYRWESISTVYGSKVAAGVMIEFALRAVQDRSAQFAPVLHFPKHFLTTPFLTLDEFQKLITDLKTEVLPQHPHLILEHVPRSSN